jgi:hypothetical protein
MIDAVLPNGAKRQIKVKIADPLSCLVMKAIAFRERAHEKDAYDLYMICKYCPNAKKQIIEGLQLNKTNKLVQEALEVLRTEFTSVESLGPISVADFMQETDQTARNIRCRDVFENIQAILISIA